MAQQVKNLPAVQETQEDRVRPLDREDPLEEGMAPILLFLPHEFHGQRILAVYSPRSPKVLDTIEWLSRKGRGTRNQIANISLSQIANKCSEKHLLLHHWLRESLCVDHNKLRKILKRVGIPALRNMYKGQEATVRTGQQWTGSKLREEYARLYIVTLLI